MIIEDWLVLFGHIGNHGLNYDMVYVTGPTKESVFWGGFINGSKAALYFMEKQVRLQQL